MTNVQRALIKSINTPFGCRVNEEMLRLFYQQLIFLSEGSQKIIREQGWALIGWLLLMGSPWNQAHRNDLQTCSFNINNPIFSVVKNIC